jgi:hypothetical protein
LLASEEIPLVVHYEGVHWFTVIALAVIFAIVIAVCVLGLALGIALMRRITHR